MTETTGQRPAQPELLSPTAPTKPEDLNTHIADDLMKLAVAAVFFFIAGHGSIFDATLNLVLLTSLTVGLEALLALWDRWRPRGRTARKVGFMANGATYLLLLAFALKWIRWWAVDSPKDSTLDLLILAPLATFALWKLLELWRRWRQSLREVQRQPIPARKSERRELVFQPATSPLAFPLWLLTWLCAPIFVLYMYGSTFFMLLSHDSGNFKVKFILLTVPIAYLLWAILANGFRRRVWLKGRYGYDATTDRFYREHSLYHDYKREADWTAGDFLGLYWEEIPWVGVQLWLAAPAGGEDVLMAELHSRRAARRLAAELSAASGLPVLYRWRNA